MSNNPIPPEGYRLMTKEDFTLTEEEKLKTQHLVFSICMDSRVYSEIIGRRIYGCMACYECMGDCSRGGTMYRYVNDTTGEVYIVIK
jgi:heterodisulfide reductase subunit C